ncbi:hypothetical protein EVAR_87140_1 [Eumeta japonica]|uniref:Uncharacterized protein n=1 Tax=Eumeta variegata TaxID=151549 RepID=A0A4C1VWJ3_EUMVA|nr:hypothetical protein EVAR_87140_1 [Eumeta japonica]
MFSHVVTHRPSTIDIALTKGVALNFNSIETIHGLTSDHRRCSYQPRQDSGRGERAGGSGILGSPEVSARYSRIDKSKKRSFAPRERISHSRVQIQSASSPTQ